MRMPRFISDLFDRTLFSAGGIAWAFLLGGLACTGLAWWQARSAVKLEQEAQLAAHADDAAHHFRKELAVYSGMLKGVQTQLAARPDLAQAAFRRLVAGAAGNEHAENIQAIGVARRMPAAHGAGEALVVQMTESVPANGTLAGQDLGRDPERRRAIERARDSGELAVTSETRLFGSVEAVSGIVLYLPLYRDDGDDAPSTLESRRRLFDGVVFMSVRTDELLRNAFGGELPANIGLTGLHMQGGQRHDATGKPGRLVHSKDIELGGQRWRIDVAMDAGALNESERWFLNLVLGTGVLFSFMVFGFTSTIERRRRAALARARAAEATLDHKERELNLITSLIDDVLWTINLADLQLRFVSDASERIAGQSAESLLRAPSRWLACVHPADRRKLVKARSEIRRSGAAIVKFRIVRPDGDVRWLRSKAYLIADEESGSMAISGISTDVTDLQLAYGSLKRSHRALRALYRSERDFAVATSEASLVQGICDVIVDAGYRFAWIGLPDACGEIVAAAASGFDSGYLQHVSRDLGQGGMHTVTIAEVQATGRPAIVNRLDSGENPLRGLAVKSGLRAKVALPVAHSGELLGILSIYAAEEDAFDEQEVDFLSTLSYSAAVSLRALRDRQALHAAGELLRLRQRAIEACNNPVAILRAQDPDFPIEYVNPAFERHAGHASAALAGQGLHVLMGRACAPDKVREIHDALKDRREARTTLRAARQDGSHAWLDVSVTPVAGEHGEISHFVAVGYDVTAMVNYENDLRYLAYHDALTGLANRELMHHELDASIARGQAGAQVAWLLMIDLDRFKYVNDTLGHHVGDQLLKIVGARLKAIVGDGDVVARLGGDEFVIILRAPDSMRTDVVERIMRQLSMPVQLEGNDYVLTSSIGIAMYPKDGPDRETLMKNADIAMYRAKSAGRNTFEFYEPDVAPASMHRIRMEAALRSAVERGEFVLYYQPQVDVRTRAIVGMEALLRWDHPEFGLIPPGDFLDIAEETGIIEAIGAWVMRTACRQTRAWQQAGLGMLRVAVNLSHRQFHQGDLAALVASCLEDSGLPAACLDLELTEGIIMREVEQAIGKMDALKALGVQLSVDDFGTGYSSLAHLKRFPVDVLKVDRSFVLDIERDRQQAAITRSIITLARNLDLEVIAEGVENERQLTHLAAYGCDQVQGFYFSRPVPAERFEAMLRAGRDAAAPQDETLAACG